MYYKKDKNNNLEFYLVQKISLDKIPNSVYENNKKLNLKKDGFIYMLISLGNVFVNENNEILSYTNINRKDLVYYINYNNELKEYLKDKKLRSFK